MAELDKYTDTEILARYAHETYERLAPKFGYQTRDDTKQFDPASPNGRLMIAVFDEILDSYVLDAPYQRLRAEVSALRRELASLKGSGVA